MRLPWAFALVLAAGCQPSTTTPDDAGVSDLAVAPPADLAIPPHLVAKFATQLSVQFSVAGKPTGLALPIVWGLQEEPNDQSLADFAWELCDLPLPGLTDVPLQYLDPSIAYGTAKLTGRTDGIGAEFPTMSFVLGARLKDPINDPLPSDGKTPCSDTVTTGCVIPDMTTMLPGVAIPAEGLDPDVDLVYLDYRVRFAASYVFSLDAVDGTVSGFSVESHVLACHLRAGADCAPADVAKLEAAHAQIATAKVTARNHIQGFYFTCPQLLADPEGSVTGVENLVDAGVADLVITVPPTFSNAIQDDLDSRGCATGGCHETFTGPQMMHLTYKPDSAGRMQNYQQVLPWTMGQPTGGRFVNEVPLPPDMRDRWLTWIANGKPF
jgi:hypothetical protein